MTNPANIKDPGVLIYDTNTALFPNVELEKGGILTFNQATGQHVHLPVGSNQQILISDDAEDTGLKWITPSGDEFILCQTFSDVSMVDFTTALTSQFDKYLFVYDVSVSTPTRFRMRLSTDGGSTFLTSNYGTGVMTYDDSNNFVDIGPALGAEYIGMGGFGTSDSRVSASANAKVTGRFYMAGVNDANNVNVIKSRSHRRSGDDQTLVSTGGGFQSTTSIINAIRFFAESGTISGRICIYGVEES